MEIKVKILKLKKGCCLELLNRYEEAIQMYDKAIELKP